MNKTEFFPGSLKSHTWTDGRYEGHTDQGNILRVEPITDYIIRVRYSSRGYFEKDFSYAIDPAFDRSPTDISYKDGPTVTEISTPHVKCRICKADSKVTFLNKEDHVINKDEKGFHYERDTDSGNDIVQMSKTVYSSEVFYGLGDKPTELNLKGRRFENWGMDCYGYDYGSDPLYKNIPFYYGLHGGIGYGIFFDNTFRTFFDFGKERKEAASFWAHGGEMNYYFIAGPRLLDVNQRYAQLTGTPDMPALWSLGFQQCKWSYYPESEVREVTTKMRDLKIPCDAIYLDIDYMDGFRCFTWDKERFPDPKGLVSDLKDQGYKTMVIIDPGIKKDPDYWVCKEGVEKGYFLRRLDGPYAEGKVWPGDCYFPDYTNPEVREWWADLYQELIGEIGVAGVWNDMNEPALFEVESKTMPDDVMFHFEGSPASHRKAHNIYGLQMARATYEGVKKHAGGRRGLIITRSGYSGLQRYSSVWTGDNISTWQHVWIAGIQCQRLAISGVSFAGSDIGGFIGQPTPKMMARWIQLAIFHPFCRVHSSQDDGDQEPWSFGEETLDVFREAVELRYKMLPYHYTAFWQHHKTGYPILTPLSFYDQYDPETHSRDHEFLCGDHILTAPITKEKDATKEIYLPQGKWFNFWDDSLHFGGAETSCKLTNYTFPLFVKEGAIIPMYPVQQYVGEKVIDTVSLHIYYKQGEEVSYYFDDAHDGYGYEDGDYREARFDLEGKGDHLIIKQTIKGNYDGDLQSYECVFHGFPAHIKNVIVDDTEHPGFVISAGFKQIVVRW